MKGKLIYNKLIIITMILVLSSIVNAATPVSVVQPEFKEINNVRIVNSKIEPYQDIQISAKNGGIIEKVNVQIGDYVEKGQALIQLEQDDIKIQLQQAEAAVEIAEANYKMLKDGASKEDRISVEAAYQQALASYQGAKESLKLLESSYRDRTAQKQQLIAAETQLKAAEKQIKLAEENLAQAVTGLEQAEKEYERIKYLFEENVASKSQFEMVESQYRNTLSVVESARLAKEQANISYQGAKESYILAEDNYNNPIQLEQQLTAARSQLLVAEANVQMAKANLEKVEKGARAEEIQIGEANVKQARATLQQVQKALEDTIIRSPFDGIISQLNFDSGEIIGPGTPVTNIVNLEKIYVSGSITEDLLLNLEKGQKIRIRILAGDNQYLEGVIEYISPVVDPRTQAFTIKVLADNPHGRLRGGMFAELYIPVAENKNALVLPISTIMDLERNPYVYTIINDKAVKRPVKIGIIANNYVEIISGLSEDELVAHKGQNNLEDAIVVEVVR